MSTRKRRPYRSDVRATRALRTRASILGSAKKLFSKRGIDPVTIDDVARDAGVSSPTVYALFQSKAGLLKALTERALFDDALLKLVEEARALTDPAAILKKTASIACAIYENEKAEMGLIRGASSFSNDLKRMEAELETIRFTMQEERCKVLWKSGAVKAGLDLPTIRDIVWMYTSRDVYRLLVIERGWSAAKFEGWLAASLVAGLLRQSSEA